MAKRATRKTAGAPRKLTQKERRFIEEYLVDLNATKAAVRAGYSERTAYSIGHENLRKPEIAAAIEAAMAARSKRTEITADRVLQELAKIGFSDIRKAVRWRSDMQAEYTDPETGEAASIFLNSVRLVDSGELDEETAAAIASVSQTDKGALKITFHDKQGALVSIGRHLGMFEDKLTVKNDLENLSDEQLEEHIAGLEARLAGSAGGGAAAQADARRAKPARGVRTVQ